MKLIIKNMHKKKIVLFLVFISIFFVFSNALAQEKIDSFDVKININQDASIDVSERIEYDFDSLQKHGIFRDLPLKYQARGGNFNLRISDISVTNENNAVYKFSTAYSGQNIRIKIGDEDKYVTGKKIYIINYKIKRAINFFSDHDELYWNVTGNEWLLPINKSYAKIILPKPIKKAQAQAACFAGSLGSQNSCAETNFQYNAEGLVTAIDFIQPTSLGEQQGLTIVAGWPKGIVVQPSFWQNARETIKDNWILLLPLITLIIMLYLWWTRGRDPKGRETIIAQYDAPDNLTPTEIGTLIDERVDAKDISSEIIYLATKGYLKITRTENKGIIFKHEDYLLEKTKEPDNLKPADKRLMEALFPSGIKTKNLSDLKNKFYKEIIDIKNKIITALVVNNYFPEKPSKTQGKYMLAGFLALFAAIALNKLLLGTMGALGIISLLISGVLIIIFGLVMPVKTKKGVDAKENILGLKLYLEVAEKDRIKFHDAPEKNPDHFEKLLPYAMVLGVEKEWAEKFKDIYSQPPSWYSDPSGSMFNSIIFINALNNFNHSSQSAMFSAPGGAASGASGFGGGGFSGGGFGGGGGGSW